VLWPLDGWILLPVVVGLVEGSGARAVQSKGGTTGVTRFNSHACYEKECNRHCIVQ
jgi:hypothetical protein